jgi:hypothetical protein
VGHGPLDAREHRGVHADSVVVEHASHVQLRMWSNTVSRPVRRLKASPGDPRTVRSVPVPILGTMARHERTQPNLPAFEIGMSGRESCIEDREPSSRTEKRGCAGTHGLQPPRKPVIVFVPLPRHRSSSRSSSVAGSRPELAEMLDRVVIPPQIALLVRAHFRC